MFFTKKSLSFKNRYLSQNGFIYFFIKKIFNLYLEKYINPLSKNKDLARQEFIFNIILTGFIFLVGIFGITLIEPHLRLGSSPYEISVNIFIGFFILFIGLLVLSRKGYFKVSIYIFLTIYLTLITWNALNFGVELPIVIISYIILVIISGILIGTQFSIFTTILISSILILLGYLQINKITNPDIGWRNSHILFGDVIQYSTALFLIAVIMWLSNREIETSLRRARKSEKALALERDNLELIVTARTKEIKSLQAEKVAQLYRSAEFGRLSSGLFHDLMNPLNALIGSVESLKSDGGQIKNIEKYLEKSISISRRMGSFLGSIQKQVSRHSFIENFSCDSEILEVVEILNYRARENSVNLNIKNLSKITILGNLIKFHQIAINLIANAIDSYKNTSNKNRNVDISLVKDNSFLLFEVSDNGSGINKNIINKIFDPFFTTKDPYRGTGLGLSTTKSSVEDDFSGKIYVSSTEGVGSIFTIKIPLKK